MISQSAHLPSAFVRLAWSNLAAQSAEQIALAAAAIVAVIALGAREAEVGLLQMALTLPFLLFAIPAGLLADRISRPRLMVWSEGLRAASLLAILCFVESGLVTWPLLAFLGALAACGTVAYSVATPAFVPSLVPPTALPAANARIELARTLAFTGGPAIGGALIGSVGAGTAFAAAAGLSLVAVMLLAGLHENPRPRHADRRPLRDMTEGLAFVARHALLRPILLTQLVFSTAFFLVLTIFVPYAVRHLGLTASGIGLTLGFYGAGMVVGALLATTILRRLPFGIVVGIGPIAGLAASLLMALTIWVPTPWLAALSLFVFGVGPILWVVSTTTLRQAVTPPPLLGRVSAVSVLTQGARPLGAALAALIGGIFGAEACLLVAVLGFAAQAAIIWTSPAVDLLRQPAMDELAVAMRP